MSSMVYSCVEREREDVCVCVCVCQEEERGDGDVIRTAYILSAH